MYGWSLWLWWTAAGVAFSAGFVVACWAMFWDRARGRLRCPSCWYQLDGVPATLLGWTCPECGKLARRQKRLRKTRRKWSAAAAGLLLMLGVPVLNITVYLRQPNKGWWNLTPTPVLLLVLGMQDEPNMYAGNELTQRLEYRYEPGIIHDWMVRHAAGLADQKRTMHQRWLGVRVLGALAARGKSLEVVVDALNDQSDAVREAAVSALQQAHPPLERVRVLAPALARHPELWLTERVLRDYAREFSQEEAAELREILLPRARADIDDIGGSAVRVIGALRPMPPEVIEELTVMLESGREGQERYYALQTALGRCGAQADRAGRILVDHLKSGTTGGVGISLRAIGQMGHSAADAAPLLEAYALDKSVSGGFAVEARAIQEVLLGKEPSLAKVWVKYLDDADAHVREQALWGICRLEREEAVALFSIAERALADPEVKVRVAAACVFLNHKWSAADWLPVLREARRRETDTVAKQGLKYIEREIERAEFLSRR